jgi:hypothetical protein
VLFVKSHISKEITVLSGWHAWILLGFFPFISCWNLKEAYGKETSDTSDEEEWSGKENLEDSDSDSLDGSHRPAKTCSSKRGRGRPRNVEHTPRSEERTEVLHSNGSSSMGRKGHGPIVRQV